MNEHIGLRDQVELLHVHDGKVVARRVTGPDGRDGLAGKVRCALIKGLKMVGLGKQYADDLITYAGIVATAATINTDYTYVGIGTSTTAAATTQTDLVTPSGSRVASTNTIVTTTWTNDTSQHSATFTIGAGGAAITESGLFTASSGGVMLCRQTFSVLNLAENDQLIVIWKIKVS
jgi:hypothetical protein